jgi:hypothetical protein
VFTGAGKKGASPPLKIENDHPNIIRLGLTQAVSESRTRETVMEWARNNPS